MVINSTFKEREKTHHKNNILSSLCEDEGRGTYGLISDEISGHGQRHDEDGG